MVFEIPIPYAERLGGVIQNAGSLPSGVTEWVCIDQFTFPVPPDPKHVCLLIVRHSGGIEMATQQENPDKGLLMIGAVVGGIAFLVVLATFFGAI